MQFTVLHYVGHVTSTGRSQCFSIQVILQEVGPITSTCRSQYLSTQVTVHQHLGDRHLDHVNSACRSQYFRMQVIIPQHVGHITSTRRSQYITTQAISNWATLLQYTGHSFSTCGSRFFSMQVTLFQHVGHIESARMLCYFSMQFTSYQHIGHITLAYNHYRSHHWGLQAPVSGYRQMAYQVPIDLVIGSVCNYCKPGQLCIQVMMEVLPGHPPKRGMVHSVHHTRDPYTVEGQVCLFVVALCPSNI